MNENLVFVLFLALPCVIGGLIAWALRYRRTPGAPAGWGRLLLGNLLVLSFLLALLVLAGEIHYRWFYDTTDALDYTKASERWLSRYWHLNSAESRDNIEYNRTIAPGKRRVTFVGDSFSAGYGVKDVEDRFTNRIRRAHPEWEVHLLAKAGFETGEELEFLRQCSSQGYQLDRVVLVYCLNDVADLLPEWEAALKTIFPEGDHRGWLRRNSYLVDTLYHRLAVMRNPYMREYFHFVSNGYRGEVWEQQKQRLRSFRDLVESSGGRLAVVTFPFLHAVGPSYEYRPLHEELDRFWRELGVPHLDLLPVYRDQSPRRITVNRYDAHPSEFAHELATETISTLVKQQLSAER